MFLRIIFLSKNNVHTFYRPTIGVSLLVKPNCYLLCNLTNSNSYGVKMILPQGVVANYTCFQLPFKSGLNAKEMSTFLMIFWQTPQGVLKPMRKEEMLNTKNYC